MSLDCVVRDLALFLYFLVLSGEPVVLLMELLQLVRGMKFLNGPWLMFNAFIFTLLK